MDKIVQYRVKGIEAQVIAVNSLEAVKEMQKIHQASYTATAAAGRVLSALAMMTMALKNPADKISIQITVDGPIKGIVATARENGDVKMDIYQPLIYLPLKDNGKLDVSGAVGKGTLTVVKDMGMKTPYTGTVPLVSGEIAEDFTYYFAASEQTPSVVALGVLIDSQDVVLASGGFMIQLLPGASEETISYLEKRVGELDSVTTMLGKGFDTDEMITSIFEGKEMETISEKPLQYKCDCSRERIRSGLSLLKKDDLQAMISEDDGAEVLCHFCNSKYHFDRDELGKILDAK
ncbi:Hsp33 family molecular chaperone HslO [Alkalibacter rhizosphaerae]|uniref:33 kDa chaperonin n=1 Tax=Alkalibacter rhizosphaerae TaxID=2815577 RepID=A0A974XHK1_9FIRM|nr:Hsp33 family molecular chaperone HslO [Alkalibacter rhizosphaerae]QSX08493.1 Hsp33 family molecular chaperone HslO [Alkalibacter rhizosphaerae]